MNTGDIRSMISDDMCVSRIDNAGNYWVEIIARQRNIPLRFVDQPPGNLTNNFLSEIYEEFCVLMDAINLVYIDGGYRNITVFNVARKLRAIFGGPIVSRTSPVNQIRHYLSLVGRCVRMSTSMQSLDWFSACWDVREAQDYLHLFHGRARSHQNVLENVTNRNISDLIESMRHQSVDRFNAVARGIRGSRDLRSTSSVREIRQELFVLISAGNIVYSSCDSYEDITAERVATVLHEIFGGTYPGNRSAFWRIRHFLGKVGHSLPPIPRPDNYHNLFRRLVQTSEDLENVTHLVELVAFSSSRI